MTIAAFYNPQGRSGVTSLVYHLAWMCSDAGLDVLVVDLDPQSSLTRMFANDEDLDPGVEVDAEGTLYDALGASNGGATSFRVAEPAPGLGLAPGGLLLGTLVDELSRQWSAYLAGDAGTVPLLTALSRILDRSAADVGASMVLVDLGPNVGVLNRTALALADLVVAPVVTDLPSLQGLRVLGPTIRQWREEWVEARSRNEASHPGLSEGGMQLIGYVVVQRANRLSRLIGRSWYMSRIPRIYSESILDGFVPSDTMDARSDPHCLGVLRPYDFLEPMAREASKPIFRLKSADGVAGGQERAVRHCHQEYRDLAKAITDRAGLVFPE